MRVIVSGIFIDFEQLALNQELSAEFELPSGSGQLFSQYLTAATCGR